MCVRLCLHRVFVRKPMLGFSEKTKHFIEVFVRQNNYRRVAFRMRRALFGQATSSLESCDHERQTSSSQTARTTEPSEQNRSRTALEIRQLVWGVSTQHFPTALRPFLTTVDSQTGQDGEISPSTLT